MLVSTLLFVQRRAETSVSKDLIQLSSPSHRLHVLRVPLHDFQPSWSCQIQLWFISLGEFTSCESLFLWWVVVWEDKSSIPVDVDSSCLLIRKHVSFLLLLSTTSEFSPFDLEHLKVLPQTDFRLLQQTSNLYLPCYPNLNHDTWSTSHPISNSPPITTFIINNQQPKKNLDTFTLSQQPLRLTLNN